MAEKITTIKLTEKTKRELASLGAKGETFEQIVRRLLREYKQRRGREK